MNFPFRSFLLNGAAVMCFGDAFLASKDSEPGPWAAGILGILLLRRGIIAVPQPPVVIVSGCVLTGLLLAGNHNLLNVKNPIWIAFILAAGILFAFWERLEQIIKQRRH